jgi:hypothetical protein
LAQPPSALTRAVTDTLRKLAAAPADPAALEAALRHLAKWRSEVISNTMTRLSGAAVLSGPFQGMAYPVRASEGSQSARLLGTYEAGLAPVIEAIVARGYDLVIDVGSAEGYYAVGLARRMPGARVMARDEDPRAQALCRAMAEANGVADRVEIGGRLGHDGFDACTGADTLVICDIEGAEAELMDPEKAPGLLAADILVEAHDCIRPGLADLITARFSASHKVERIDRRIDASAMPDWMNGLSDLDRLLALWEWRGGPTPWLWMTRK